jgi:hypothetical protein
MHKVQAELDAMGLRVVLAAPSCGSPDYVVPLGFRVKDAMF